MEKKVRLIALGAGAALLIAVGAALCIGQSREADAQEAQDSAREPGADQPPAPITLMGSPDGNHAIRDLVGSKPPGNRRPVAWGGAEFSFHGKQYSVWFLAVQELDDKGKLVDCHACAPELAAVTYERTAKGWTLSAVDPNLGKFGSWGKPPANSELAYLGLGKTFGLTFEDVSGGQGFANTDRGVLSFDDNWTFLGYVPVAADNSGTGECAQQKSKCWSWAGALSVGDTVTNGYPDLLVARKGTESTDNGKIAQAASQVYAYSGSQYDEKAKVETAAAATNTRNQVTLSELRRMVATGMELNTPYWVRTRINGYDNFGDQLCDSVRPGGYCDPGHDSVHVRQSLNQQARRDLYDLRGRAGAAVCVSVEMRKDGDVYLTEFSPSPCG